MIIEVKDIGAKVRELRTQTGVKISLDVLAERTGLSKSYLSEFERGHRGALTETLHKIFEALGCRYIQSVEIPDLKEEE